jgi:hypothetical protein
MLILIRNQLFTLMRIRIQLLTLLWIRIRIRILLLFEVMRACVHWSTTLQSSILSLHASVVSVHGPPRLYLELLKLLNFYFNTDPDPAVHSHSDPDPASKNYADPNPYIYCYMLVV